MITISKECRYRLERYQYTFDGHKERRFLRIAIKLRDLTILSCGAEVMNGASVRVTYRDLLIKSLDKVDEMFSDNTGKGILPNKASVKWMLQYEEYLKLNLYLRQVIQTQNDKILKIQQLRNMGSHAVGTCPIVPQFRGILRCL